MNIWEILEIEPTTNVSEIENACAKKYAELGLNASEEECQRLHKARLSAIEYANQQKEYEVDTGKGTSLVEVKVPQMPKQITFPKSITLPQNIVTSEMIGKSSYLEGIDPLEEPEKIELPEGIDHPERIKHPDRIEHPDKVEHPDRIEHPGRIEASGRINSPDRRDVSGRMEAPEKRVSSGRAELSGSSGLQNRRNVRLKDWDIEENTTPKKKVNKSSIFLRVGIVAIIAIVMIKGIRTMREMNYIATQMQQPMESVTFEYADMETGADTKKEADATQESFAAENTEPIEETATTESVDKAEETVSTDGTESAEETISTENDILEELVNQEDVEYGVEYDGARAEEKLDELLEMYDKMQMLESELF